MGKINEYVINLLPSGMVGAVIGLFGWLTTDMVTPLPIVLLINFSIGAVVGTVAAISHSWALYKGASRPLAYAAAFVGNGLSVLAVVFLFRTYLDGWRFVLSILAIAEVLGMGICIASDRSYRSMNRLLRDKKRAFKRGDRQDGQKS